MIAKNKLNTYLQKSDKFLNIYLMFACIFTFNLLFIFQGLDTTDFGYHMTHQVLSFTLKPEAEYTVPMIYLTDFIGGMWLSIIGHPNVLWARLGGVLLEALNAVIIFSILGDYFDKRKVFFVVFISSIIISLFPMVYIHYFTFPAFLTNIALWTLNKAIRSSTWSKRNDIYSFFLGFMVVPIILSRITLLLILIIPILFTIYYFKNGKEFTYLKRMFSPAVKGILFSVICFGLIYWYLGILDDYFLNVIGPLSASAKANTSEIESHHVIGTLIKSYVIEYIKIIILSLGFILGVYTFSIIKEKIEKKTFYLLMLLLTFLTVCFIFYLERIGYTLYFVMRLMDFFIGVVITLSLIYFIYDKSRNKNIDLLLISGIAIMMINPIGSDTGLYKSEYGMWLPLPLSFLCLYKIREDVRNSGTRFSSMLSLTTIFLVFLLISTVSLHATFVYQDDSNRFKLNTEFSDPSLKGVYSTSSRVELVDELLSQTKKYSDKNDKILIIDDIPIFYYLTETKPSFGEPWTNLMSFDKIKEKQRELENKKELPKLFIYSKVDTSKARWPEEGIDNQKRDGEEKLRYLKIRYTNNLNYSLLWENEAFAIYGRPPT